MMRWWLDRGVDGFRMDVINFISKEPALPDGPMLGPGPYGVGAFICGPRIHEFLQEMHRESLAGRSGLLTVGEMPGVTVEQARLFTDPARAEVDMVFQFEHVNLDHGPGGKWDPKPFDVRALKASFGRWQAGLAEVGWNSLYWNNHDQPRIVSRWGDDSDEHRVASATALGTVLHLHRGTPYVYQGEEIGMTNADLQTADDLLDVASRNHYVEALAAGDDAEAVMASIRPMARDNARTPMQWDDSPNAGFTSGTPWMPVNANHNHINVAAAVADDGSVYAHYRRLIELRHTLPVIADGDFTMLLADDPQVYAFTRKLGDDRLLVIANLSGQPAVADISEAGDWTDAELLLGNLGDEQPAAATIDLRPWEARIYQR
jgi:oligo-1,6-glucosidase